MSEGIAKKTIQEMMQSQIDASNRQIGSMRQQLEAAKQRELELLAVIERMKAAYDKATKVSNFDSWDDFVAASNELSEVFNIEPSQALREHEAELFEKFGNGVLETVNHSDVDNHDFEDGKEAVAREALRMAEERRKNEHILHLC